MVHRASNYHGWHGSRGCSPACAGLRVIVLPWYDLGMKVTVSIPQELFDAAETVGKRLRVSRSHLYATALAELLTKHRGRKVTERLNQVYGAEESRLDNPLRRRQAQSVRDESW